MLTFVGVLFDEAIAVEPVYHQDHQEDIAYDI